MLINTLLSLLRGYHVDLGTVAAQVISILFVILCILPLHELAHAWVANKLGDPTAKLEGRLTFNPLASVDLWAPWHCCFSVLAGLSPYRWTAATSESRKEIWPLPPWLGRFPTCWLPS